MSIVLGINDKLPFVGSDVEENIERWLSDQRVNWLVKLDNQ